MIPLGISVVFFSVFPRGDSIPIPPGPVLAFDHQQRRALFQGIRRYSSCSVTRSIGIQNVHPSCFDAMNMGRRLFSANCLNFDRRKLPVEMNHDIDTRGGLEGSVLVCHGEEIPVEDASLSRSRIRDDKHGDVCGHGEVEKSGLNNCVGECFRLQPPGGHIVDQFFNEYIEIGSERERDVASSLFCITGPQIRARRIQILANEFRVQILKVFQLLGAFGRPSIKNGALESFEEIVRQSVVECKDSVNACTCNMVGIGKVFKLERCF